MLPFQAEYAKSSRSTCFVCRQKIEQGNLRLAVMVQAKNFDAKIPQWHHFECFFKATSPPDCNLIQGYSDLRWEDQQKLKSKSEGGIGSNEKSSKTADGDSSKTSIKLTIPTGKKKLKCMNCLGHIDVTVFAGVHVSLGQADSKKSNCMHLDCFAMKRDELQCSSDAKKLDGFKDLPEETQKFVKEQLPASVKRKLKSKDGPPAKHNKLEEKNSELEEKLKEQNDQLWKLRDHLEKTYKKPVWESMLSYNNLGCPKGNKNILDQLVDAIYFGNPDRCGECKGGRLIPTDNGYKCIGNLTEWTRCMFTTQSPVRSKFRVGPEFSDDRFLKLSCKDVKEKVFPKVPENKEETIHVDSALEGQKPLDDLNVVIDEDVELDETTKSNLLQLGADFTNTVNENTAFIVVDSNESKSYRAKAAAKKKVHAIKLIHCSRMKKGSVAHIMKNCNVAQWEVKTHKMQLVAARETAALIKARNESGRDGTSFEKQTGKDKIMVSSGGASGAIDGSFFDAANLIPGTKVQLLPTESKDGTYNAVLNLVDIVSGMNSFYKLQIVEVPSTRNCYLYRSWGRVGTNIGGSKVEVGRDYDLKMDFKNLYLEKTGNHWDQRRFFEKKPGKFFLVDVDYEIAEDKDKKKSVDNSPKKACTLPIAVQKVVEMIFDVKNMENAMIEFEIDLKKMPLGKLSKKQIKSAYTVLTELSNLIAIKEKNRGLFIDATNRFYTLIPHDFGVKSIPTIDSEDVVKEKGKMLDNLLEIEVAYSLLGDDTQSESQLDTHYKKLKCDMVPLERKSKDYKMVEDFVKLTHCDTHYLDLVVLDVFKIARGDEESRFKKWAQNDNRMLLWHGSRITNFAGILSQGLRIAPPEAPRSGYMFGKGIYFADMVTKSANYCCVSCGDEGLMLLAEVALGEQHFLEGSDSSLPETLPQGCNSTKGCGRSYPDKKTYVTLENGTVVPIGEQVTTDDYHLYLRYNEYIVYDLSQVQLRYLVKLRFGST